MKRSACFTVLMAVGLWAGEAIAVDRTWGGGSSFSGNNWNRAQNWTGDTVPGAGDIAIFDGTQTADCTLNVNVNVAGMRLNAGYSGTVTQSGNALNIGSSGFVQSAGTFAGDATQTFDNAGATTISGGTFTAPGTMTLNGNLTISGGTFNHNGGTVTLTSQSSGTLNASGVTFNNLTFNAAGNRYFYVTNNCTVLSNLVNRAGNPSWYSHVNPLGPATITLKGNFSKVNSTGYFSVPLILDGTANQSLTVNGESAGLTGSLTVSKPSGWTLITGSGTVGGALTIVSGVVTESVTTITRETLIVSNGAYTVMGTNNTAASYFSSSGGLGIRVYGDGVFRSVGTRDITAFQGGGANGGGVDIAAGGIFAMDGGSLRTKYFNNSSSFVTLTNVSLWIQRPGTSYSGGAVFGSLQFAGMGNDDITVGDDFTVLGDVVIRNAGSASYYTRVYPSGTRRIVTGGSFSQYSANSISGFQNSSLTLLMTGTNATLNLAVGVFNANLAITNGGSVALARAFTMGAAARVYPNSTLNLAGSNFTATALTIDGTLRLQGNETLSPATPTLSVGSTVRYDGDATPVTVRSWAYKKLDVIAPGRTIKWTAGSTYNVAEGFTVHGASGGRVLLRSTTPGSYWYLTVSSGALVDVSYVDVQDSNAGGGQAIETVLSTDSGHNVNWRFNKGTVFAIY